MGRGLRVPLRRPLGARPRLRPAGSGGAARACARPRRDHARRRRRWARARWSRRHVDGGDGHRDAQSLSRRRSLRHPDRCLVAARREPLRLDATDTVRHGRRRLAVLPQPAGDLLLGVDLLPRRVDGAAGTHPRHDGARCRRHRHRLDLLGRGDVLDRGRGLLRGCCIPRRLRPPRSLVRDAGPRGRERCDPDAARSRPAHGSRLARW